MKTAALQLLMSLLTMVDSDLVKDAIDFVLDKVEVRYHDDPGLKAQAIMALCAAVRRAFDVPDDDVDQANPV